MKEFTKQDLKTGMWIRLRNDNKYLAMLDYYAVNYGSGLLIREKGFVFLSEYEDDLTHSFNGSLWDIIEVLKADCTCDILNFDEAKTIWKREEPKTLTEEERIFLSALNESKCWIARDKNGGLFIFNEEPDKDEDYWNSEEPNVSVFAIKKEWFPFIKFDVEKPYLVKELLKWEIKK